MLKTHIKFYQDGTCEGVVTCINPKGEAIWNEYTDIIRLDPKDAKDDAEFLSSNLNSRL